MTYGVYEYSIATAAAGVGGLATLSSLGVFNPASDPLPYSVELTLGDGSVRGLGWATTRWHWGFVTLAQWNTLRAYCPGKSADVVIRTYSVDDKQTWTNYSAKMIWPTGGMFTAQKVIDFTLQFQALVAIP
jgi:hypothetical protein